MIVNVILGGYRMLLVVIVLIGTGVVIYKNNERIKLFFNYKKRLKNYREQHHLSQGDLELFKETMGLAKVQIIEWEELIEKSNRLKKSTEIKTAIKSAQEVFKRLMEYPNEMTEFDDFLYIKLPGVLSGIQRYETIESSKIKTEEIKESMETIYLSIITISESITDDYEESIVDVMNEVGITEKMIEKNR